MNDSEIIAADTVQSAEQESEMEMHTPQPIDKTTADESVSSDEIDDAISRLENDACSSEEDQASDEENGMESARK